MASYPSNWPALSQLLVQRHSIGQALTVEGDLVVVVAARWLDLIPEGRVDPAKEGVRGSVAQEALVLEDDQLAGRHFAAGRRAVVLEHVEQGLPDELEILFGEAGVRGEVRGDEAVGAVESVRHDLLAAHGPHHLAAFFDLRAGRALGGHGFAGDRLLERHDRIEGARKRDLYRAPPLAAVD